MLNNQLYFIGLDLRRREGSHDETIDLKLSSSLINFEGTFQETFQQSRTWFDPLIGGKLGIQVSNPLFVWVRGDYAGFDLAGETDYSWNVYFGVDWWVLPRLSLQLAYRFYEINYRVGNGNNAYGFSQNLNSPYISATFHFYWTLDKKIHLA